VPSNPKSAFGKILVALRESTIHDQKPLSQEALAEACKLSRDYISKLERGLAMPSVKTIEKLARQFDLTGEQLYHRFILKMKNEGIYEHWITSRGR
jgi:transcriptional regulator with XRE-family HTH domain